MKLLVILLAINSVTTTIGVKKPRSENPLFIRQKSFYADSNKKNNILSPLEYDFKKPPHTKYDIKKAHKKAEVLKHAREKERKLNDHELAIAPIFRGSSVSRGRIQEQKSRYHRDPVLNVQRRRAKSSDDSDSTGSSSVEMEDWKDEFKQHWLEKKLQAMNASRPRGDTVNMVAARPWGVQCGDPNQHDMPWGTCMLAMECESEYRIYRGDAFCGRTQFVCCAIQTHTYDMYMGIDISLEDSSFETDSAEKNDSDRSKGRLKRKRKREKIKRKRNRKRRKKKLKKTIKKITQQIQKMLKRNYRNGTKARKKRTKQLKRFLKELKKRYKKNRQSIRDIHEIDMIKIDAALMAKLKKISVMNKEFASNKTFRDWITNRTMTKAQARMLVQAYPDLASFFIQRRSDQPPNQPDYLDYDIEYGMVYY